jgi:hypothetical protein
MNADAAGLLAVVATDVHAAHTIVGSLSRVLHGLITPSTTDKGNHLQLR